MTQDRFLRGFISGLLAGAIMQALNLFLVKVLNFGQDLLIDYSGEMLTGSKPATILEGAVYSIGHLIWTGFLGAIFVYLLLLINSNFIILKGIIFSLVSWFLLYGAGIMFEIPLLKISSISTVISIGITGVLFGFALPVIITLLDKNKLTR